MSSKGAKTIVDGVEVVAEDLVLRHHGLELEGEQGLLDLAIPGSLLSEEGVLGVLLRDGRAANG